MSMSVNNPPNQQLPLTNDKSTYDLLKDDVNIVNEPEDLLAGEVIDENEPEEIKEEEVKEEKEEKEEDEIEIEEEDTLEDIDPNNIELQTPIKMKEVLAKYPNIKKEFPELFAANFREQKYAELLPTIEDAKIAVERSETLGKFEEKLFSGETAPILSVVKNEDPAAFNKIVDGYLPALKNTDEKAYFHVVGGVINQLAHEMVNAAASSNNEDLKIAAQLMYQYAFGNKSQPQSFGNASPKENTELDKIKQERAEFEKQKFDSVHGELSSKTDNLIKSTIDKNIDPKGVMPPYVKRNAINDCLNTVKDSIKADTRFNRIIEGMWRQAAKNGYKTDEVNKIRAAILGKSKTVLKEAILKTRNEALKGISTKATTEKVRTKIRPSVSDNDRTRTSDGNRKLSTLEILSQD